MLDKIILLFLITLLGCSNQKEAIHESSNQNFPVAHYLKTLQPRRSSRHNPNIAFYADLSGPANEYRFLLHC